MHRGNALWKKYALWKKIHIALRLRSYLNSENKIEIAILNGLEPS